MVHPNVSQIDGANRAVNKISFYSFLSDFNEIVFNTRVLPGIALVYPMCLNPQLDAHRANEQDLKLTCKTHDPCRKAHRRVDN